MEVGRFSFARSRSLFALSLFALCSSDFKAWAQQAPTSSPVENTVPAALPTAQPVSQAAIGSARSNADSTKATPGSDSIKPVASASESSSMRLGVGDLLEVGVYNV